MRFAEHPPGSPYQQDLDRNPANHVPLSPISFLERTADVFPERTAWVHGEASASYRTFRDRSRRLASALERRGIGPGDTVAVMLPNTPPMLEAHFGVPMAGAVLNSLNIRLEPATIAFILAHGEAKALITDAEFAPVVEQALAQTAARPLVVDVVDPLAAGPAHRLGDLDYEDLLAGGDPAFEPIWPADEWQAIGLNYTSGTTGHPKGVVIHHRGAYLNAIGQALANDMGLHPTYLWTLPMFHCNGWTFTWGVTLQAGTHVCLRRVEAGAVFDLIERHRVSHLCGAPIVMNMIANAPEGVRRRFEHKVQAMTGGAAPPAAVLRRMADLGIDMVHLYGLTESYGPSAICAWQSGWHDLAADEQAERMARQGVRYPTIEALAVLDEAGQPIAGDGSTIGELCLRGNTVMKGYLKDPEASRDAFRGGFYHTGDLAAVYPDGYAEVRDRAKDIIISGGENISSIEVEGALYRHPAVLEAAVVARPDPRWGESPCAFVTLKPGHEASADELIAHCRTVLAHFKAPRTILFGDLPKTATGKIQKHVLRDQVKEL